MLRERGF